MNRVWKTEEFQIDGLRYRASITVDGAFAFELIGGHSAKGSARDRKRATTDLYYANTPDIQDRNLLASAVPVFLKVKAILLTWILSARPHRIHFGASTARKVSIYRWMAQRLSHDLFHDYVMIEHPEGHFQFICVVKKMIA